MFYACRRFTHSSLQFCVGLFFRNKVVALSYQPAAFAIAGMTCEATIIPVAMFMSFHRQVEKKVLFKILFRSESLDGNALTCSPILGLHTKQT